MTFVRSISTVARAPSEERMHPATSRNPFNKTTKVFYDHFSQFANWFVAKVNPALSHQYMANLCVAKQREQASRIELLEKHKELQEKISQLSMPSKIKKFTSGGWIEWAIGNDRRNELKTQVQAAYVRNQQVDAVGKSLREVRDKFETAKQNVYEREECARQALQRFENASWFYS